MRFSAVISTYTRTVIIYGARLPCPVCGMRTLLCINVAEDCFEGVPGHGVFIAATNEAIWWEKRSRTGLNVGRRRVGAGQGFGGLTEMGKIGL